MSPPHSERSSSTPEYEFAAWLARRQAGEQVDFEALCREHPAHEPRLRALHAHWTGGKQRPHAIPAGGAPSSRPAQPRGLEGGSRSAAGTQGQPVGDLASEVLTRLAGRKGSSRYSLEGEVARGGMGAILRVWDEDLRRHLAMKVVLGRPAEDGEAGADVVDPRVLARFLEEARVTGKLDHPGIVPVHELGLDAEGRVYFTMKLVVGKTLAAVFDELARGEGGWTQPRVLGLLLRVCEAMSYAHSKGVIHRDLKPANIMVGRFGEVYVMDWGVAKVLGREGEAVERLHPDATAAAGGSRTESSDRIDLLLDSASHTLDGDVLGTPAYMPPEQAAGHLGEMGPHSDVYALGAMLYHLLAGHMPYFLPGTQVSSYDVWRSARKGPPQALHEIAPQTPAELVAICEKAMARDPKERYPDMSALAADLSAFIEGRVVSAYETGAWAEARKWIRRNRSLASALAAAVILAVGGLGGIGYVQSQGRKVAERERQRADDKAELASKSEAEAQRQREAAELHAKQAQEERRRAEEETAKVLRLSDVKVLVELEEEADALWPAHPERIPAFEAWLERARALASNLPGHRSTLQEMRGRAQPRSEDEREHDRRTHPRAGELASTQAELANLMRQLDQGLSGAAASAADERAAELEAELAALEDELSTRRSWSFAQAEDQWQHDVLAELIGNLEAFEAGLLAEGAVTAEHGWSMPRRLAFARKLEADFGQGGRWAAAWAAAEPALRADYPALELGPQMGLVPIGRDPDSGLWEFAHLMSGDPPARRADGQLALTEASGIVLVLLPSGSFHMGAQSHDPLGANYDPQAQVDEGPVREVELSPFLLAKHEMTQGQWERLTGRNPSLYGMHNWDSPWLASLAPPSLLHPVEQVTWLECESWLARAGLALPSEAQWEYGARGGTQTPWWTGAEKESLAGAANLVDSYSHDNGGGGWAGHEMWLDDGAAVHAPVGTYAANGFGLLDVTGNVFEWCRDGYVLGLAGERAERDPVVQPVITDQRVYRGGGFAHPAALARSSTRFSNSPTLSSAYLGLRPARAIAR